MGQRYNHIDVDERARIALLCEAGQSLRQIAAAVGRPPSTISRELKRNSGNQVGYKPSWADDLAWSRRWRGSKLERQPALRDHVLEHLAKGQSPEQIAGRLTLEHSSFRISHESIYRFIYAQIARTKDTSWRNYLAQAKSKRGWTRRLVKSVHHIKGPLSLNCESKLAIGKLTSCTRVNQVHAFWLPSNAQPAWCCLPSRTANMQNPWQTNSLHGLRPCRHTCVKP
jgi:transposase, IS30 family